MLHLNTVHMSSHAGRLAAEVFEIRRMRAAWGLPIESGVVWGPSGHAWVAVPWGAIRLSHRAQAREVHAEFRAAWESEAEARMRELESLSNWPAINLIASCALDRDVERAVEKGGDIGSLRVWARDRVADARRIEKHRAAHSAEALPWSLRYTEADVPRA